MNMENITENYKCLNKAVLFGNTIYGKNKKSLKFEYN